MLCSRAFAVQCAKQRNLSAVATDVGIVPLSLGIKPGKDVLDISVHKSVKIDSLTEVAHSLLDMHIQYVCIDTYVHIYIYICAYIYI